ncbi:phage regulatory CII family protein [Acinetobacter schindleri]|uniref:phage regulatory CII family protein n=1 Tax=Acinetobacter schindleri TaxID=108981 RepID=UPI0013B0804A|nr:phage regulatory CII family protein [Acinetobacter schindleri]QIC63294.1 Rha family transcriptional regulator [Acinetobacter schindleri]
MINKNNKVLSLSMALRAAVYSDGDQSLISQIAEKNCWNLTTFRNSLCPTTTTHKANIHHLEAVLAETQDRGIMDSICAIHGNAGWFELPEVNKNLDQASYINKLGELAQEQGQLAHSIATAVSDGLITLDEKTEIQKEVLDLVRVATTILAMVKNQYQVDQGAK